MILFHLSLSPGTHQIKMSLCMRKPTICIWENKDADQLCSNCTADQRLCFRNSDSAIPLLLKSEISSFLLFSVLVQVGLCQTCSETTLLVFPRGGSNNCRQSDLKFLICAEGERMQCSYSIQTKTLISFAVLLLGLFCADVKLFCHLVYANGQAFP